MASPFDYISAFQQQGGGPFGSVMQGLQAGAQFGRIEAQRAQEAAKAEAERMALDRQRQIGEAMSRLMAKPTRTFQDYEQVAVLLPEKEAASLRANFDSLTKERQASDLAFGGQVLAAFGSKAPDVGIQMLKERAAGERNAGREDQAKAYETWAQLAERDPESARATIGVLVSRLPGGDKVIEGVGKVQEQQRARALFGPVLAKAEADAETAKATAIKAGVDATFAPAVAQAGLTKAQSDAITAASSARFADALNQAGLNERNWNVRNVQNQIGVRSRQLQLDETKTAADVQLTLARVAEVATSLPDQAKKDINTAAVTAGTAKQQAVQFNSLADRIDQAGGGFGVLSRANEFLRTATGNQDYVSQLRQEFTRLRNSAAVQSLPPGPATDRDIALVLEGFPPPTADARVMSSFLRGMAKLQDITAATENARVDWLSQNRGSLGRARDSFKAGDFTARPGETWVDLSQRIAADIANRYAGGGTPGAQIPTTMQPPATPALTTVTPGLPTTPGMPAGFRLLPPGR